MESKLVTSLKNAFWLSCYHCGRRREGVRLQVTQFGMRTFKVISISLKKRFVLLICIISKYDFKASVPLFDPGLVCVAALYRPSVNITKGNSPLLMALRYWCFFYEPDPTWQFYGSLYLSIMLMLSAFVYVLHFCYDAELSDVAAQRWYILRGGHKHVHLVQFVCRWGTFMYKSIN